MMRLRPECLRLKNNFYFMAITYKKVPAGSRLYSGSRPAWAKPDYAIEALDEAAKRGAFDLSKLKKKSETPRMNFGASKAFQKIKRLGRWVKRKMD
jgi:hypothetical protein